MIWGKPSRLFAKDEKKWLEFKEYIKSNKLPMPDERYMDEDTRLGYRFMQATYWDNQDTYEAMINN